MSFPPPPFGTVWEISTSYWLARALHAVTELNIADQLGEEPMTADALAKKANVQADQLFRVVRLLAGHGIFQIKDGKIAHTPASQILRADNPTSMRGFVRVMGAPILWSSYQELEHAIRSGQPAIHKVEPKGFFAYMQQHPEAAKIFDDAMASKSHATAAAIVPAYDWTKFNRIADIGGGRGILLKKILEAAPKATGVLFELPHITNELKSQETDRFKVQEGDFFKGNIPACDAYILMHIVHDWDEASNLKILGAVREAAPPNATLLVMETLLPDANDNTPHWAKLLDIQMMTMHKGRERTGAEYGELLGKAGWKFTRVVQPKTNIQIVEAVRT